MQYGIGNLGWDLLKFSFGFWFGVSWVYGNRHVTTKSLHQGMLNTIRNRNKRINELLGVSDTSEELEEVDEEFVEAEFVDEVGLEPTKPPYRPVTAIMPQPQQPNPPNKVRVYQVSRGTTSANQEIKNLEVAPAHIRRLPRVDNGSRADG